MRQKRAQLVGGHPAARYRRKARRPLWNGPGRIAADNVAIGAPLTGELRTFLYVGLGGVCGNETEAQYRQGR